MVSWKVPSLSHLVQQVGLSLFEDPLVEFLVSGDEIGRDDV
jgi:hypothetical protein